MKWMGIILLCCIVPTCFAEVLVTQDFEDETFPPAGWSADNYYPQMYWSRFGDESNHYAWCSGIVFITVSLYTPSMSLTQGDILNITFGSNTTNPQDASEVALFKDSTRIWSATIARKKSSLNSFTLPALTESGSYSVHWIFPMHICTAPYSLKIDNVVISRNMGNSLTQVSPSSLGRIKSAYK
jgi:hypothetical protein